jgi:uncharacterized repeat protein (TIGR01451 family)
MKITGTNRLKAGLVAVAMVVGTIGFAGSAHAIVQQGLGVSKGCNPTTTVGQPYTCAYAITNNSSVNPSLNTLVVSNVTDKVFASSTQTDSALLSESSLVFTQGSPSCVGGSGSGTAGDPYIGATSCTLPVNSQITSEDFSHYQVQPGDYNLDPVNHELTDQVDAAWKSLCNATGTTGCSTTLVSHNQAIGATTVQQAVTSIVTSATGAQIGSSISDSATISGLAFPTSGGSVVFTAYGPEASATCAAGDLAFTSSAVTVTGNGTYGPVSFTPTKIGNYFWIATFTDTDGGNTNAATSCGDTGETSVVTPGQPTVTTSATASAQLGTAISDSATITGLLGPTQTGTIVFTAYGPEASATCAAGDLAFTSSAVAVNGNGTYGPVSFTPTAAGKYFWIATFTDTDGNNGNATTACGDNNETSTVIQPLVQVTKTADPAGTVIAGSNIGFDITVSNIGTVTASSVSLNDPLPTTPTGVGAWTIASGPTPALTTCSIAANVLSCAAVDLAAGASYTVKVTATTGPTTSGTADNTATITSPNSNCTSGSTDARCKSRATVPIVPALVQVTKTADPVGPVIAGSNIGFDITVSNIGTVTASGVSLNDPLPTTPAGVGTWTIASGPTPALTTCSITANVLSCAAVDLAVGASYTVKVTAPTSATTSGTADNTATITSTNANCTSGSTDTRCKSRATVTVNPPAPKGLIAPTQTTCSDFLNSPSSFILGQINYSVSGGKISQNVNPGVFFYYTTVTVGANSTVTVTQSNTAGGDLFFSALNGQANAFTGTCGNASGVTVSNIGTGATYHFTTAGTYILSIKYQTKTIAGDPAPSPSTVTYTFTTSLGGSTSASVKLVKQ